MTGFSCGSCEALSSSAELVCADRQRSQALARGGEDGGTHRRRHRRYAGLADAAGLGVAREKVNVELRHLVQTQHSVTVEVALFYAPVVQGNLAPQRGREPVDDATLYLRFDDARIDRL